MYYVLNFVTHQFTTCHSDAEVCQVVRELAAAGITAEDNIEVVNCWDSDIRCSGAEFLREHSSEEAQ